MRLKGLLTIILLIASIVASRFHTLKAGESGWREMNVPEDVLELHKRVTALFGTDGRVVLCIEDRDGKLRRFYASGEEIDNWPSIVGTGRSGIVSGPDTYRYWISDSRLSISTMDGELPEIWSISNEDSLNFPDLSIPAYGRFMAYESFLHCSFRVLNLETGALEWEVHSAGRPLDCYMEYLLVEPNGEFLILVDQSDPEEEQYSLIYREAPSEVYQRVLAGKHSPIALSHDSSSLIRLNTSGIKDSSEIELEVISLPEFEFKESFRIASNGQYEMALSPEGNDLALLNGKEILLYSLSPFGLRDVIEIPEGMGLHIAISPDGDSIFVSTTSSKLYSRVLQRKSPTNTGPTPAISQDEPVHVPFGGALEGIRKLMIVPRYISGEIMYKLCVIAKYGSAHLQWVVDPIGTEGFGYSHPGVNNLYSYSSGWRDLFQVRYNETVLWGDGVQSGIQIPMWIRDDILGLQPGDVSMPDESRFLAYQSRREGTLNLLDPMKGTTTWTPDATGRSFSAENEVIILATDSSFLLLGDNQADGRTLLTRLPIETPNGPTSRHLKGHTSRMLLSGDDSTLFRFVLRNGSATQHDRLEVLRASDFKFLDTLPLEDASIHDVAFTTTGEEAIAFLTGPEIRFYDLLPFQLRGTIPVPEQHGVAFGIHPEETMVFVGTKSGQVYRINLLQKP